MSTSTTALVLSTITILVTIFSPFAQLLIRIYEPDDKLKARRKINMWLLTILLFGIPYAFMLASLITFYFNVYTAKVVTPNTLIYFAASIVFFIIGYSFIQIIVTTIAMYKHRDKLSRCNNASTKNTHL